MNAVNGAVDIVADDRVGMAAIAEVETNVALADRVVLDPDGSAADIQPGVHPSHQVVPDDDRALRS